MSLLVAFTTFGCSNGYEADSGSLKEVHDSLITKKGEGQLNIIAWEGYIERGKTDPEFDWVTSFENTTNCKVTTKTANTSDEMLELALSGNADIIIPSSDVSHRFIVNDLVKEINPDLIPSWDRLDDEFKHQSAHYMYGKHYGVPLVWGENILLYNTEVFPEAPDSWNIVYEEMNLPDGKSNIGRIQAYAGTIHIADAANYLMFHRPELGINDPYELTREQYSAVLALLKEQRRLIKRYWSDINTQIDDFTDGSVVASGSWRLVANLLKSSGVPVAATVPREGTTGYIDTQMIRSQAEHPVCAYQWLEHSLSSNLMSDLSVWNGVVPTVTEACSDGSGMQSAQGCISNGQNNFHRIKFWSTPKPSCATQEKCVPYSRWLSDYFFITGYH
ncbi:MAG: ABC transporter substrate-binding protein [Gammaproteobacteria bacterium]|nr:ABC transporter substrate-binding protein [Gammaproteobacteria bacterium]MDE0514256.1 ABC transporter substrate-binding protein [Gammaproteobacteria bacterium]